jgi:hypothetical protein
MKIAIVSDDFPTVGGKSGRARRFLLFDAPAGSTPAWKNPWSGPQAIRPTMTCTTTIPVISRWTARC